jgi:Zn-dependent protease with chaperone function
LSWTADCSTVELWPWACRCSTIATAAAAAGAVPFLDGVFEIWGELFLRIAMPISRQQELRADELACRLAGTQATISGLTKLHGGVGGEIADPVPGWEQDLHKTHPPLRDRLALTRSFRGIHAPPSDDR